MNDAVTSSHKIEEIIRHFAIPYVITRVIPWGNGLINDTYRIYTDAGDDYLMQRMNTSVYSSAEELMTNIFRVTSFIARHEFHLYNGEKKDGMHLIPLKDGRLYYEDEDGSCWRVYNFLRNSYSIEKAENADQCYHAGLILGQFHYMLQYFPIDELYEILPGFHDFASRLDQLNAAFSADVCGRAGEVRAEVEFLNAQRDRLHYFEDALRNGRIPLRVNHNDTKINNFMFTRSTDQPICMVDLDTMQPGLLAFDFGDGIRSVMCTGRDREGMDFSDISFREDFYESYLKGFLEYCGTVMTEEERRSLPLGAKLILLGNAMRYLTDYLQGDQYFKVKYPSQNLTKCRLHLAVLRDMDRKLADFDDRKREYERKPLNILITNDDGIDAEGLWDLAETAGRLGRVWVVAPGGQCSAMAHRMTIRHPMQLKDYIPRVPAEGAWSLSGMPVDCVKVAIHHIMPVKPDLILSGINKGLNCGFDILYSATVAAALEGRINDIPSIAISMDPDCSRRLLAAELPSLLNLLVDRPAPKGAIWNVNFPGCKPETFGGIDFNNQIAAAQGFTDSYCRTQAAGVIYLTEDGIPLPDETYPAGTDMHSVRHRHISVGPVYSHVLIN